MRSLPDDIKTNVAKHGLRNSHLIAIAPTGTISLLAHNVSSGIEPVFAFIYTRRTLENNGSYSQLKVSDYAWRFWNRRHRETLPRYFIAARDLPPHAHLTMQAAVQPYVDQAISKTINVSKDLDFSVFQGIYEDAYTMGLKGCTTYRANPVTGELLSTDAPADSAPHCGSVERECD